MKALKPFEISLSGTNLIEASAGTGKTYNIASLYVRAIIDQDRLVDKILVVTYTEAATKELRDRLLKRLRQSVQALEGTVFEEDEFLQQLVSHISAPKEAIAKLRQAIHSFDEAAVFTIHSFCQRILQKQAFESRALFDAELIGDDSEVIGEIVDDFWRNWVQEASENGLKQPLLKFLMEKGIAPDSLTAEMTPFIGKPYLQVRPQEAAIENADEKLYKLQQTYEKLKKEWDESHQEIFALLDSAPLAYYRTDWLEGWVLQMHDWMAAEVPSIKLFDKFEKFVQPAINDSLKKSASQPPPTHPFFRYAASYKSLADSLEQFDVHFKLQLFEHLCEKLAAKKEQLQVYSFDDLLVKLRDALSNPDYGQRLQRKIRQSYPIALVDEFQDTDPIQYQIFKMIYAPGTEDSTLFMIGDPKQSIYGFRGADIFTYLQAKADAPKQKVYNLNRNFRSVPPLIDAVNRLFSFRDDPFILDKISYSPIQPGKEEYECLLTADTPASPVIISTLNLPDDELPINKTTAENRSAEDTASRIQQLLEQARSGEATIGDNPIKAADIAVLVRTHHQADSISNTLKQKGIKSVQYSQESVFNSNEARELQYVLKAVAEPSNEGRLKAALITNLMGYGAEELLGFEENEEQWIAKMEQFRAWNASWQEKGVALMIRRMMSEENVSQKLIRLTDGERKLTNLIHLAELLQEEQQNGTTGSRSLVQWLARKRHEEKKKRDDEQLRLESDENLVKVVTMHRSKGLEYPIVFCPFLWKGPQFSDRGNPLVYHGADNETVFLDFNGKNDPDRSPKRYRAAVEDIAESVRLAYVAITRAKHRCVISWAQADKTELSPLGYLLLGKEHCFAILKDTISSGKRYKSIEASAFDSAVNELCQYPAQNITRESANLSMNDTFSRADDSGPQLSARTFNRGPAMDSGFTISSFSSLTRAEHEQFDHDAPLYFDEWQREESSVSGKAEKSIFSFPKGPDPGTGIHHIFEDISFKNAEGWEHVIADHLTRQSIDAAWVPVVRNMVERTLGKELLPDQPGLQLQRLNDADMIAELEFHFSSDRAQLQELLKIIRPEADFPSDVFGFSEEGYIKGFIDLTFKYRGRYYILDYKTNHLGDTKADYSRDLLQQEMHEAYYDVQYHIYSVALHRFLKNRLPDYRYSKNFGGAFYLFLRGINLEGREGIYFDCPPEAIIHKLDIYLGRGTP